MVPPPPLTAPPALRFPHQRSGKVREIYALEAERLLLLATDRVSAFDVVLTPGIPGKGAVLNRISRLGLHLTRPVVPNHLVEPQEDALHAALADHPELRGRAMVVQSLRPLPVECIVRGHLAGSAWTDYVRTGAVQGQPLPPGLVEGALLPTPLFTPTTKAEAGHDQPLTPAEAEAHLGRRRHAQVRALSLRLYAVGARWGAAAGLLLADTKFEFGLDAGGQIHLIDEVFTPDSSRWWDRSAWRPGSAPVALDKQPVRDWLAASGWDRRPPGPRLPDDLVASTAARYASVGHRLAAAAELALPALDAWARIEVVEERWTAAPGAGPVAEVSLDLGSFEAAVVAEAVDEALREAAAAGAETLLFRPPPIGPHPVAFTAPAVLPRLAAWLRQHPEPRRVLLPCVRAEDADFLRDARSALAAEG